MEPSFNAMIGKPHSSILATTVESMKLVFLEMKITGTQNQELLAQLQALLTKDDGIRSILSLLYRPEDLSTLERIGDIINSPPVAMAINLYFPILTHQLLRQTSEESRYLLGAFVNRYSKAGKKLVLDVILNPLKVCVQMATKNEKIKSNKTVVIPAQEIESCINDLEIMLRTAGAESNTTRYTLPLLAAIFSIYEYGLEHNMDTIRNTLRSIISKLSTNSSFAEEVVNAANISMRKTLYCFIKGPSDFPMFCVCQNGEKRQVVKFETIMKALIDINDEELLGNVFVLVASKAVKLRSDCIESEESEYYNNLLLHMLSRKEMSLRTASQHLSFLRICLIENDHEMVTMGLTLLLSKLSSSFGSHADSKRGVLDSVSNQSESNALINELTILLSELSNHGNVDIAKKAQYALDLLAGKLVIDKSQQDLNAALEDLCDEQVPNRAHGLNQIQRLIESESPVIKENLESIIGIYLEATNDEDSYINLHSMRGLKHLVKFPLPLQRVVETYSDQNLSPEYRCRLGEIIGCYLESDACNSESKNIILSTLPAIIKESSFMAQSAIGLALLYLECIPVENDLLFKYEVMSVSIKCVYELNEAAPAALQLIWNILQRGFVNGELMRKLKWTLQRVEDCSDLLIKNQANNIWNAYFSG